MNINQKHKNTLIETKDLMMIGRIFIKNLTIIFLIPLTAYIIGYIYTYRLTDIYGAEAQLLLKSNETYDYQDQIYQGLGAYSTYTDIQNQIRILQSRGLIGEVIDKMDLEVSQFIVGRLRRQEVYFTLPFDCDVVVSDPKIFEIPISIEILDENRYELIYELDGNQEEYTGEFERQLKTDHFHVTLNKLYGFDDDGLDIIKKSKYEIVVHTRDYLIAKYQSNIQVENIEFTSILNVSVTDEIANRGTAFLDTLCNTYVDYSKRIQLEVNQNTLDNIQKQIDTVRQFIEEKEASILNYKENNAILDIDRESSQYFVEYFEINKAIREFEEQRASITLLEKYLSSENEDRTIPPYFYIEKADNNLADLLTELRMKQSKLETLRTQISEDNTGYKNLRKEIQILKGDVKLYLSNLRVAIISKIELLNEELSNYRGKIVELPKSAQDIMNIQRELDVNNKMYLYLLEKKTNTLITRAGIIPQVRIIEETRSLGVVRPDKTKIKTTALLAGLILALVIAFLRTFFFDKIETVKELSEITNLSLIGGVPHVAQMQPYSISVDSNPKSQLTESFRTIRTNLSFLAADVQKSKTILISSFFPGEGKTFTSVNLATILARSDKKVLLLDFDLHKPKIHKMFQISNEIGVTSYLIGKSSFNEIIRNPGIQNLDIISAGPIAPNPSELVLKLQINQLFERVKSEYDFVIIDTPPFGLLNDALTLSVHADIFMVVANTKVLRKKGVGLIEEILGKLNIKEKGIVLNGVKQRRLNYYYSKYIYKYNYGYSYGYGYGYGSTYHDSTES